MLSPNNFRQINTVQRLLKSVQIELKLYFVRFFLLHAFALSNSCKGTKIKSYKDTQIQTILKLKFQLKYLCSTLVPKRYNNSIQGK